jgi:(E)-4-hydroxy-3-methylbut-2-enyl-diphosphate synthase
MKSSDTSVMIESTRMLVSMMQSEGLSFPLHLGVTEAGEGEDGRIRSSAGIGALLAEGIGDTIRVSLSEDPEKEIPVARNLAGWYPRGVSQDAPDAPIIYKKPVSVPEILKRINGPIVVSNLTSYGDLNAEVYKKAGYIADPDTGEIKKTDGSSDLLITRNCPEKIPPDVSLLVPFRVWYEKRDSEGLYPLFSPETFNESSYKSQKLNVLLTGSNFNIEYLKNPSPETTLVIFTFNPEKEKYAADFFLNALEENRLSHSIVLNPVFNENIIENLQIKASSLLGRYLIDKRITGISITNSGEIDLKDVTALSFSILQCTETRITRTMYLSCPTCGRTKFNLQESVKKVKEATGHLKGLKIAIMGCIVNGPGEMAGADYGYIGAAEGMVHIYKGTVPVLKNIPQENAVKELLKVIEKDRIE